MSKEVPVNEQPFSYHSANGTLFKAERNDFQEGLQVYTRHPFTQESLLSDTMEMAAYHAREILPKLNGFAGYGNPLPSSWITIAEQGE